MKLNYFKPIAALLLMMTGLPALSQVNAVDDNYTINGLTGGYLNSVRGNDIMNGATLSGVNCDETIVTLVSAPLPGIALSDCGGIQVQPAIPAGTYVLQYQLCDADSPNVCDTATVTITVCEVMPVVIDSYTPLGCNADTSTIQLSGLPATGTWTLTYLNFVDSPSVTGTGPITTLNFQQGSYAFRVTNDQGCRSAPVYFSLYPPDELVGDMIPSFEDTNSDGVVSVGDHISYIISLTNTSECPITDIELTGWGYTISGGPLAVLAPNTTDTTTFSATYELTQDDINNGMAGGWYIGVSGDYDGGTAYTKVMSDFSLDIEDGIRMVAFIDDNDNGIMDGNEQEFTAGEFSYQLNGGDDIYVNNGTGHHNIYETNPANTYSIGYHINNLSCADQYDIETSSYSNITVANLSGLTTYYFPITISPCTDLMVYMYGQQPVPGMNYNSYIFLRNEGNQTIVAGNYVFTADPNVTINSVSEPSAIITPTGFTYGFTDLQPQEVIMISVNMAVPALPVVSLGDIFTSSVTASIPDGDSNVANNSFTLDQVVVGSYDPNDKAESHGREIVFEDFGADDYLTYTIRFENEGTANAHVVRIEDVLDAQLDKSTVRMLSASHSYVMERNDNTLTWVFNDIQLPPSQPNTNSMTGKGFVVFQVKPVAGYAVGDVITNEASIFFDTNPVIVTNETETEFVAEMSIADNMIDAVIAYPNPVKDILYLKTGDVKISGVQVTDITGKIVMESNTVENSITTSSLSKGMYFVKIQMETGAEKAIKIIKE